MRHPFIPWDLEERSSSWGEFKIIEREYCHGSQGILSNNKRAQFSMELAQMLRHVQQNLRSTQINNIPHILRKDLLHDFWGERINIYDLVILIFLGSLYSEQVVHLHTFWGYVGTGIEGRNYQFYGTNLLNVSCTVFMENFNLLVAQNSREVVLYFLGSLAWIYE